jgi:hypothetical protein
MDSEKTQTTTKDEITWLKCARCGRIYPEGGMRYTGDRYFGDSQWMCECCYDDMYVSWDEAFERNEEEEQ